jgi:hypothetical protein
MHFNIILPSTPKSNNSHLFFRFPQQNPTYNSLPPHMPHAQPISLFFHCIRLFQHTRWSVLPKELPLRQTLPAGTWCAGIPREAVSALNRHTGAGLGRASRATFQVLTAVLLKIRLSGCDDVLLIGSRRQGQACGIAIVVACLGWSGNRCGDMANLLRLLEPVDEDITILRKVWNYSPHATSRHHIPEGLILSYSSVRTSYLSPLQCIIHHPSHNEIHYACSSWISWPLEMGQLGCPGTTVRNYCCTLRNNPEERGSHVRGGSMDSRRLWTNCDSPRSSIVSSCYTPALKSPEWRLAVRAGGCSTVACLYTDPV